jgi:hypothetical protein
MRHSKSLDKEMNVYYGDAMKTFSNELRAQFGGILRAHSTNGVMKVTPARFKVLLDDLVDIAATRANEMLLWSPKRMYTEKEIQVCLDSGDDICFACGQQFLTPYQLFKRVREEMGTTAHEGRCGLCQRTTGVTHVRSFNYLRPPK